MNRLKGKVLAITRDEKEAAEFSRLVKAEAGRSIALPTIEIMPGPIEAARLFVDRLTSIKHEFCAFLSAQAVEVLFTMAGHEEIIQALRATSIIAVGPKTKATLEELGVQVTMMPSRFSSEGMIEMLSSMNPAGKKIIIPRSAAADEYAAQALKSLGMHVDEIVLYGVRTRSPSVEWKEFAELLTAGRVDVLIFTSASSVESFFEILNKVAPKGVDLNKVTNVLSIGPFTSRELRKRAVVCVESQDHTVRGTIELATAVLSR